MAQLTSNIKIPFTYDEKTASGATTKKDIILYTVFDSDLKKTFVYSQGTQKPLATIGTDQKVIPYQEGGSFIASSSLQSEFSNNTNLTTQLKNITRSTVKRSLGSNDPSLISKVSDDQIDTYMGTKASASNATPAGEPTAAAVNPEQSIDIKDDLIKDANNVRPEYPTVVYPTGLADSGQDYIKFAMYRYKPKGLSTSNPLSGPISTGSNISGSGKGSVILPIQSPAGDSNTVGWSDGSMSGIDAAVFNTAYQGITGGLEAGATAAGEVLSEIVKNPAYKNSLGLYFAQQAAQINGAFARSTGAILNPNLELLFQAPQLRSFNFVFKLSARDATEATNIRQIIRFFKQGMSVKKSDPQLFLKTPDIFKVTYNKGNIKGIPVEHKSLNKFKTCALQAFNVDYTPLGSYMTYADEAGTMVAYTITMQFQELDPIYDDDYGDDKIDEIGY
jgi:hypothetical protein